jgi:hypothetical protein
MKRIYFVTEGRTDQIVIQGLLEQWMGKEDFIPIHIQPPYLSKIVKEWTNCTAGDEPRCSQAVRFEQEARRVLAGSRPIFP